MLHFIHRDRVLVFMMLTLVSNAQFTTRMIPYHHTYAVGCNSQISLTPNRMGLRHYLISKEEQARAICFFVVNSFFNGI